MLWLIFIFVSSFVNGISDVFYKKLTSDFTPQLILLISSLINLIFLAPTFPQIHLLHQGLLAIVYFKALVMTIAWGLFIFSLKKLPISIAAPIQLLSSLFAILIGFFCLKEALTLIQLIGVSIVLSGLLIFYHIAKKENGNSGVQKKIITKFQSLFSHFKNKTWSLKLILLLAIFASFLSAISLSLDRYLLRDSIDSANLQFWFYAFIVLNALIISLYQKISWKTVLVNLKRRWILFVLLSIFLVVSDKTYLLAASYPAALLGLLVPLKRLSILVSVFIGGHAFQEKNLKSKILVTILMIGGVALMVW